MTALTAACAGLLVLAAETSRATWPAWSAAFLIGVTSRPLSACVRGLWAGLTAGHDMGRSAFAFDSLLVDLGYVTGPPAASTIAY
jgi:hypothetical protein